MHLIKLLYCILVEVEPTAKLAVVSLIFPKMSSGQVFSKIDRNFSQIYTLKPYEVGTRVTTKLGDLTHFFLFV